MLKAAIVLMLIATVASLFSGNYGADGAGSTTYNVTTTDNTDSGLKDTATGQNIYLFNTANGVEGRVGGSGGAVAFSVTISNGVVTLDQVRALVHPNTGDANDSLSLGSGQRASFLIFNNLTFTFDSKCTLVLVVRKARTGRRCSCACIRAGPSATAARSK